MHEWMIAKKETIHLPFFIFFWWKKSSKEIPPFFYSIFLKFELNFLKKKSNFETFLDYFFLILKFFEFFFLEIWFGLLNFSFLSWINFWIFESSSLSFLKIFLLVFPILKTSFWSLKILLEFLWNLFWIWIFSWKLKSVKDKIKQ